MKRLPTVLCALALTSAIAYGDPQKPATTQTPVKPGTRATEPKANLPNQFEKTGDNIVKHLGRTSGSPGGPGSITGGGLLDQGTASNRGRRKQSLDGLTDKPPNVSTANKEKQQPGKFRDTLKGMERLQGNPKLLSPMREAVAKKAGAKPKVDKIKTDTASIKADMQQALAKKASAKLKAEKNWGKSRQLKLQNSSAQDSMQRKAKWNGAQQGIDKSNAGIAKSTASTPGFAANPGLLDNNPLSTTQSPASAGAAAPAARPGGAGPVFR